MGKVLSIINNKGGSGKTATTSILAELMSALGLNVLLVDQDEQCNLSMIYQRYNQQGAKSIRDIYIRDNTTSDNKIKRKITKEEVEECIQETDIAHIDIIASAKMQRNTPKDLNSEGIGNTSILLKRALDQIKDDYDFIIIDNSPASDKLTVNSILASDYVLCPAKCEGLSKEGGLTTLKNIRQVQEDYMYDNVKFLGIFLVAAEPQTKLFQKLKKEYEVDYGELFFKTYIRKDIKVGEMENEFVPLMDLDPSCNALYDYANLLYEADILPEEQQSNLKEIIDAASER